MFKIVHMFSSNQENGFGVDEKVLWRGDTPDERTVLTSMVEQGRLVIADLKRRVDNTANYVMEVQEPSEVNESYPHVVIYTNGRANNLIVADEY